MLPESADDPSQFVTLTMKCYSRMEASQKISVVWHGMTGDWFGRCVRELARHYQIFKQLPIECWGGKHMSRSFLHQEEVCTPLLMFMRDLPTGQATPRVLANHINQVILLVAGVQTTKKICMHTACHWLIKLGWTYTKVKKGVYVDGHEREDVTAY